MEIINATATEARQHFNRYVNRVASGGAQVQIVRHQSIAAVLVSAEDAARLRALDEEQARALVTSAASYTEEERAQIDQRIWDPAIRALMGLPPL
jgi:prevent-host-death family protein